MTTRSFKHNGVRLRYKVRAVVPPATPTGVSAVSGAGQATVSFSGSANTSTYIVTASTGQVGTGAVSPIFVTGLANGVAVTFTVKGQNAAGTSAASAASNSVTPTAGLPGALWGTLQTDKNAIAKAATEAAAGLTLAMVEPGWDLYETASGVFSSSYISSLQANVSAIQAAGMPITWSFGAHFQPSWVTGQTALKAVGASGATTTNLDMVFDQRARALWMAYVDNTHTNFDVTTFRAIRVGTISGGSGEFKYPNSPTQDWQCFSTTAQSGGANLATGQSACPFPGFIPGSANHGVDSSAKVATWFDWYVQSMVNCAKFQMDYLDSKGYTGLYEPVMPGQGIRPNAYSGMMSSFLTPASGGTLGQLGVIWYLVYEKLALLSQSIAGRVIPHCSSFGDQSGTPADNLVDPADASIPYATWKASSSYNTWHSAREHDYLAQANGFTRTSGENTGWSSNIATHYADATTNGLMNKAVTQAKKAGTFTFYWAHDPYFWNGTVSLANYTNDIATL